MRPDPPDHRSVEVERLREFSRRGGIGSEGESSSAQEEVEDTPFSGVVGDSGDKALDGLAALCLGWCLAHIVSLLDVVAYLRRRSQRTFYDADVSV